jgi:hypothetical protein
VAFVAYSKISVDKKNAPSLSLFSSSKFIKVRLAKAIFLVKVRTKQENIYAKNL